MRPTTKKPRVPSDLGTSGRRLWRAIVERFEIAPHHEDVLHQACSCLDTAEAADKQVREEGPTILDRWEQRRAHPAAMVARDARRTLCALLKTLGVADENDPPKGARR